MSDKKKDAERETLRQNIQPIVAFAEAHDGFQTQLLIAMQIRCAAKPPSRQALGEWLRRDPRQRKQPRYGIGVVLVEEARALMAHWPQALGEWLRHGK